MSQFAHKFFSGLATTAEDWKEFLIEMHNTNPGMTSRTLATFKTSLGSTSYELLANTINRVKIQENQPLHLLDLACGDGYLLQLCLEKQSGKQAQFTGVDFSPAELEIARLRLKDEKVKLLLESAQNLSLPAQTFDVVLCHMAFMLMTPLEPVVNQVARILKPGGLFSAIVNRPLSASENNGSENNKNNKQILNEIH